MVKILLPWQLSPDPLSSSGQPNLQNLSLVAALLSKVIPHISRRLCGLLKNYITSVAYDFFTPQPIRSAAVYHLRFIVHDWPNEQNIKILRNIRDAASSSSKLVIWDKLIPNACRSTEGSKDNISLLPPGIDWATSTDMQVCPFVTLLRIHLCIDCLDDEFDGCAREDVE